MSYAVRELEAALGVSVFDRSRYRAALTDAGSAILEEARAVLSRAKGLHALAHQARTGFEPQLDLVVDGALPMTPILRALSVLAREDVPTRVTVRVECRGGVRAAFERGEAHVMLSTDPVPDEAWVRHVLPKVALVLVAAAQQPLARSGRTLSVGELQAHVELTVHDTARARQRPVPLFGGERVHYLGDFHAKREALALGLGFGYMPRALIAEELRAGRFAVLRHPEARRTLRPELVHLRARALGPAAERFRVLVCGASAR